jgi:hypothetical protein
MRIGTKAAEILLPHIIQIFRRSVHDLTSIYKPDMNLLVLLLWRFFETCKEPYRCSSLQPHRAGLSALVLYCRLKQVNCSVGSGHFSWPFSTTLLCRQLQSEERSISATETTVQCSASSRGTRFRLRPGALLLLERL